MREEELTRLVDAVTEQVMRRLSERGAAAPADDAGLPRVLVLGDAAQLPAGITARCRVMGLDDYERCGNIKKYERVIIGRMTTLQLSGLALGLPVDGLCRAVTEALLNGVEVLMAADAPPHRACAGQGSRALYAMLEGYVRQLMVFGVKPLEGCRDTVTTLEPPLPPEKQRPPQAVETHARPNRDRLVTEACAKRMCAGAEGEIRFGAGTLITPAARDVFAAAGITVVIE